VVITGYFNRTQNRDLLMSDWFVNLPVVWMVLLVFGLSYVVAASIYAVVVALARGARASALKAVSPGMLPPLGILFALFVAFTASEVWGNIERANTAFDREASAAKSVLVLAASFPGEPEARLHALVRRYIETAVTEEWPSMAHQSSGLSVTPPSLAEALTAILALTPTAPARRSRSALSPMQSQICLTPAGSASSSAAHTSIWLNGRVCLYRRSAC
jgi:hypothetical protein